MISMNKKYRTRDGQDVRILCVDGPNKHYPVVGFVGELIIEWTKDGEYQHGLNGRLDLIEVKPKEYHYLNFYAKGCGLARKSREEADLLSKDLGRTHIIIIEQEEGCEPTVRIEKV